MARQPVLVLISEDPRASHRANEAMRIALGVVAGENEVSIVLAGAGAHLLDEDTDELVDGDDIAKVRASLRKLGIPFHVEADLGPSRRKLECRRAPGDADRRRGDRRPRGPSIPLHRLLMAGVLHLLKRDASPLAAPVIDAMRREAKSPVTVVLLAGAVAPALAPDITVRRLGDGDLDYSALLDLIFEADRVITW